jgi:hypothetical protein
MVKKRHRVLWSILAIGIISAVLLLGGVHAGFHHEWFRMGYYFFLSVYMVGCCVVYLLSLKIDNCFIRLEKHLSSESDTIPRKNPTKLLNICFFSTSLVLFILVLLSCEHRYWLMMSLFLSVFVINFFINIDVMITLKIKDYSKRLEQLISDYKEDNDFKEQPEE